MAIVNQKLRRYSSKVMANAKLPVVAAIPNYNMAESLCGLLQQLSKQEYAAIYVLDDASTDASREVVDSFGKHVNFVAGSANVGAGANRNRIAKAVRFNAVVHFVDADMKLAANRIPELAQDLTLCEQTGFVGGLIRDHHGHQHPFNYGPRQCLKSHLAARLQMYVCSTSAAAPVRARELRERFKLLLDGWPDPQVTPSPRQVFWSAESNLLIRLDVLTRIGGFDVKLRHHEIQDLAIRLYKRGLEVRFEPSLSAIHTSLSVRSGNRHLQGLYAELQIAWKHGLLNWFLPEADFRPTSCRGNSDPSSICDYRDL